ncbi:hypothetical protein [uncultured Desulfobacter sp.]|uniref:hypothetical protein n=1 Tax=uncultured Desulfobacter sp. TaxID=240139 RepID=UPI0029F49BEC|nr:hypothetical protein [uncultured Desulfobacter sp.]
MHLYDIIIQACERIVSRQRSDGSFEPGWNGPYNDPETPVRNTAHWLISLLKAYELTGDTLFKNAAVKAADYLLIPDACPMSASFFCRKNPCKDFSNGLVGQAWTIEALTIAAQALENNDYMEKALSVFQKHFFDETAGLWRILNVDGSYSVIDYTFNHQLWFAAAGSLIQGVGDAKIRKQINLFLDRTIESHLRISRKGRIRHLINTQTTKRNIVSTISNALNPKQYYQTASQMKNKEIGYHTFNLYAFAILKITMPDHPIWNRPKLLTSLAYINSTEFMEGIANNIYGYPYNPLGFELPFALQTFKSEIAGHNKSKSWWVEQQLKRCMDIDTGLMTNYTNDPATHAARLYEAVRLDNLSIDLNMDQLR